MAEPVSSANTNASIRDAIAQTLESGAVAVLITVVQSQHLTVGAKLLVTDGGRVIGDLGADVNRALIGVTVEFLRSRLAARLAFVSEIIPELATAGDSQLLFERIESEPELVVAGAGHVGAALAKLAALVGYRVTLIDDRAEFVVRELFASAAEQQINLVAAANWALAIGEAVGSGRGVSIAIVTRGHKQDEDCLRAALAATPDYIGMIGSKRRTNIVLEKLREENFESAQLQRVRAPIGLDIGAVSPEEVALAILAEIVAERHGGAGGSLSSWRRAV